MIAIFLECTFSAFPPVILLSGAARRQLNTLREYLSAIPVMNEEMVVVGGGHVIQDDNAITLLGPKEPVEPALTILGKPQ